MTNVLQMGFLTGILFLVGGGTWLFDRGLFWLLVVAALAYGMWSGRDNFRADYSWKKSFLGSLPRGRDWFGLVPPIVGFTVSFWFSGKWSIFVSLALASVVTILLFAIFLLGFHMYWLSRQIHIGPYHTVLLAVSVNCDKGQGLPPQYWEVLKSHLKGDPVELYCPWQVSLTPRVGEQLTLSGLASDEFQVKSVNHVLNVGTCGISTITYVNLTVTEPCQVLDVDMLLALAELGFRLDAEQVGVGELTNILLDADLLATVEEYGLQCWRRST